MRKLFLAFCFLITASMAGATGPIESSGGGSQCASAIFKMETEVYIQNDLIPAAWIEVYDPTGSWETITADTVADAAIRYTGTTSDWDQAWIIEISGIYYCYDSAGGGSAGICRSDNSWYNLTIRSRSENTSCNIGVPNQTSQGARAVPALNPAYAGTGTALAAAQPDWAYLPLHLSQVMDGWGTQNDAVNTGDVNCFGLASAASSGTLGDFALTRATVKVRPLNKACSF